MFKRLELFSHKLLPYAVVFLIATTILLPKFPVADVYGTYVKVRYDDAINAFVLFIWFCGLWWKRKTFFTNTLNLTVFFYWFVGFVTVVSALLITQVVTPNLVFLHWLRRVEYMSMFFVGVAATPTFARAMQYVKAVFLAGFFAILYGLGQVAFQLPAVSTTNREFSKGLIVPLTPGARPNATFGGHYDLAIFLNFITPLLISIFFVVKKIRQKVFIPLLFGLAIFMLVLTQARFPFAATFLTVIVLLWIYGKKLLVFGFLGLVIVFMVLFGSSLITRFQTTFDVLHTEAQKETQNQNNSALTMPIDQFIVLVTQGNLNIYNGTAIPGQEDLLDEDAYKRFSESQRTYVPDPALEANLSIGIRLQDEWPRALKAFLRNPLLGSGYSSLGIASDNDFLRMLGETGILGFVSFLFIFIVVYRKIKRVLPQLAKASAERAFVLGMTAAIISFFINAFFIDVFEASKLAILFWLFLGIVIGFIDSKAKPFVSETANEI